MNASLGNDLEIISEDDRVAPILHRLERFFELRPFHLKKLIQNMGSLVFSDKRKSFKTVNSGG